MMFEEAADADEAAGAVPAGAGAVAEPEREAGVVAEPELSERDAAILAFEKQWWKYAGAKEQAIRELFDLSATQYYQVLNTLLDSPAALTAEPMLVKRLRRMRASRQRDRTQRRNQA